LQPRTGYVLCGLCDLLTVINPESARARCQVEAYPLSSGGGVRAGRLMSVICRLAGLTDVGVKARAPWGPAYVPLARVLPVGVRYAQGRDMRTALSPEGRDSAGTSACMQAQLQGCRHCTKSVVDALVRASSSQHDRQPGARARTSTTRAACATRSRRLCIGSGTPYAHPHARMTTSLARADPRLALRTQRGEGARARL